MTDVLDLKRASASSEMWQSQAIAGGSIDKHVGHRHQPQCELWCAAQGTAHGWAQARLRWRTP